MAALATRTGFGATLTHSGFSVKVISIGSFTQSRPKLDTSYLATTSYRTFIPGDLIEPGEAYFLHSYHFVPEDGHHALAMTDHGGGLVAAVGRDTIMGVQFHPEKSQAYGLALLRSFLEWKP